MGEGALGGEALRGGWWVGAAANGLRDLPTSGQGTSSDQVPIKWPPTLPGPLQGGGRGLKQDHQKSSSGSRPASFSWGCATTAVPSGASL